MRVIKAKNVNEAFDIAVLSWRNESGMIKMPSRNGNVLMFEEPLTTRYLFPNERVLFNKQRNCNPFFHFIEALWMLSGFNDLGTLTMFAKKMADFSDDGRTVNGAYGYRWREYFGRDQLIEVINRLRVAPEDRRLVLQMWDAKEDLLSPSKDVPCNTQVYFKTRPIDPKIDWSKIKPEDYFLDMTVTNRSNDLIWGAYGANAVHFSVLHEYVASMAGMQLGHYYQVSNNAHVYEDVWYPLKEKLPHSVGLDPYDDLNMFPSKLVDDVEGFDTDLENFFEWLHDGQCALYTNTVFSGVAVPMVEAWWLWKDGMLDMAIGRAEEITARDWKKACVEWLERKR